MDDSELDALIMQRLPEWFEPKDRFSSAEVFALLTSEAHVSVHPDEVDRALERLAGDEGSRLWRLRATYAPRWDRTYVLGEPAGDCP